MHVNTSFILASYPAELSPPTCRSTPSDPPACREMQWKPAIKEYPDGRADKMRAILESKPDTTPLIWTTRAITTAVCCPIIRFVNMIPADPSKPHIFHIERLKTGRDPLEKIYSHHQAGLKFMLPVQEASRFFELSRETIAITAQLFAQEHRPLIERALTCVLNDPEMRGVALSVEKETVLATYVWVKKEPRTSASV